jgi:cyclopropane fatty-acyl-phospholipid synthase-like methyltransferase
MFQNDPIGKAIHNYITQSDDTPIDVVSDLMENDILPVTYLFRSYDKMPDIEQLALKACKDKVLDVGAGAGPHTSWLRQQGFDVTAIDTSKGAIEFLNKKFPDHKNLNISIEELSETEEKFDTILLLMNGIGLAGDLENLPEFLSKMKSLLGKEGKILCESTDVQYFYEEEDGGMWLDLNTSYQGNFKFNMHYNDESSGWFPWLYVDPETLEKVANKSGFKVNVLTTHDHSYLAELTIEK